MGTHPVRVRPSSSFHTVIRPDQAGVKLLPSNAKGLGFLFFFQAEDGIRDHCMTGVQTCALPILMAKEGDYATLRLPSGEMRMVRAECRATVGTIGNADHQNVTVGKAGRKRHMGVRPQTRGTAMNPVDHPHGGGEGATPLGNHPQTPWGVPTIGYRTRKKGKSSDRYIVRGRRRGKKGNR